MKHLNLVISILGSLTLTACSTTQSTPNTPNTPNIPSVLEQHKNISVEPTTKHNSARLIKQSNNCLIEFTGNFETGKATEYWIFKGEQLISAHTNLDAQVEQKQTVFNPAEPQIQSNFNALKKHFKPKNIEKCI